MPYENLSDSFRTNCSPIDAVLDVTLDIPLATNVAVDDALVDATADGEESPSLYLTAEHDAVEDTDVAADRFAVNPPIAVNALLAETDTLTLTTFDADAAIDEVAVRLSGKTSEPYDPDP